MNRDEINARIFNHFKHQLSPDYKVRSVRTRWIGQKDGEKFFLVRYFVTSTRFIGGERFDKVSVTGKEVRTIYDYDF